MEFTTEQLIKTAQAEIAEWNRAIENSPGNRKFHQWLRLAEIALSALDAEPVYQWREIYEGVDSWDDCTKAQYDRFAKIPECEVRILYAALTVHQR